MACRAAHVGASTVDYHLKNDPDFAAQAEAAKAHAIELLRAHMPKRIIELDWSFRSRHKMSTEIKKEIQLDPRPLERHA